MTLDITIVVICILSSWFVFLLFALFSSKGNSSISTSLLSITKSIGEILGAVEIVIWSLFPLFLFISRLILENLEPSLYTHVSYQIFVLWLGSSIMIGLMMFVVCKQKQTVLEEKMRYNIVVLESLILLILCVTSLYLIF
jgi:hypothetical protein